LSVLSGQHPDCQFVFICGMDSLQNMKHWREYQRILDNYELLVFPREGYDGGDLADYPSVTVLKTPILEISSTFIRQCVKEGRDMRHFMPEPAFLYMKQHHFYE
jgi:nicotinate-nucleotide adenylyltransferase